jgi:hypothetical protein
MAKRITVKKKGQRRKQPKEGNKKESNEKEATKTALLKSTRCCMTSLMKPY